MSWAREEVRQYSRAPRTSFNDVKCRNIRTGLRGETSGENKAEIWYRRSHLSMKIVADQTALFWGSLQMGL